MHYLGRLCRSVKILVANGLSPWKKGADIGVLRFYRSMLLISRDRTYKALIFQQIDRICNRCKQSLQGGIDFDWSCPVLVIVQITLLGLVFANPNR